MKLFKILRPGPLSTFQDQGRIGYGQYGIPPAGAMDPWAFSIGNLLVGNPRNTPSLEMTLKGIKAEVLAKSRIAITGGTGLNTLNGVQIENWRSYEVTPGDILDLGVISQGCRSYLSIAGGFNLEFTLGSIATYLPARLGGLSGRALVREDILYANQPPLKSTHPSPHSFNKHLISELIPEYPEAWTLRVTSGLHEHLFSPDILDLFYSSRYEVTPQSNRMGYRLHGSPISPSLGANLVSDTVIFGAIQVPPDGQPIILAADHQTTGGYPVIGVVASVDLSHLAQMRFGQKVIFRSISLEEAQALRLKQENLINTMESTLFNK